MTHRPTLQKVEVTDYEENYDLQLSNVKTRSYRFFKKHFISICVCYESH